MDDRLQAHLELAELSDEEFVRRAYRFVLRRDPEPAALERTVPRATLLRELVASEEFARLAAVDEAIAAAGDGRFLEAPPSTDERLIEMPWALARVRADDRVVDVGTANAEPAYVAALLGRGAAEIVGVDLAEADVPGIRTVVADVRDLPFEDGAFDLALCVSTLEHVGRDNRVYGAGTEADPAGIAAALEELRRVLAGDGRLVVTVPCGEPEDHGWFVQLDPDGWNEAFLKAGFSVLEEEIYALQPEGWRAAPNFDPTGVRYGGSASAVLCATLAPVSSARRIARRARGAVARRGGGGTAPPTAPPPPGRGAD
ncbi:MAG TPA: class I SAM-dependent methyltransferase [Candidatus Limnocylindria bacterium]|nr:class I SAM-dependent methyltransferase [Candidatus Limnocylindria bacterium]